MILVHQANQVVSVALALPQCLLVDVRVILFVVLDLLSARVASQQLAQAILTLTKVLRVVWRALHLPRELLMLVAIALLSLRGLLAKQVALQLPQVLTVLELLPAVMAALPQLPGVVLTLVVLVFVGLQVGWAGLELEFRREEVVFLLILEILQV